MKLFSPTLLVVVAALVAPSSTHAFVTPVSSLRTTTATTSSTSVTATATAQEVDATIASATAILVQAAETKGEDSETVISALLDLEKCMRQKAKSEGESVGKTTLAQLNGDWRLVFTTGTATTQEKYGTINYFPIKAVQTFRTTLDPMEITNGIFVGDFPLVQFYGDMDFDLTKRKIEFDFNELVLLNFLKLNLGKGEAAKIGASSGLGSESNVANAKKGRAAFFNWISADATIATARGGGGGLALWKRIEMTEE